MIRFVCGLFAALLMCSAVAHAHTRSMSYSRWTIGDGIAQVEFRITELELTRFPHGLFDPSYLSERLVLMQNGKVLRPGSPLRTSRSGSKWVVFQWSIPYAVDAGPLTIRNDAMLDIISSHQHFARVTFTNRPEQPIAERLLDENRREWTLGAQTRANGLADYFELGVGHILGGWDHLAFLLALIVLAPRLKEVAILVTGFTVAHSITLGLAVLDVVRPASGVVEIYVAFSIGLVAVENFFWTGGRDRFPPTFLAAMLLAGGLAALGGLGVLPPVAWAGLILFMFAYFSMLSEAGESFRLRAILTFAFGLVHGFGFAGALMDIGLPSGRTVAALFGFNVGVEVGQLGVVALAWPILACLRVRRATLYPALADAISGGLVAASVFWLCLRNFAN